MTLALPDAQATYQVGVELGRSLPVGTTLLLYGDLGSGKTTLTQGIGAGLGITDPIVSPTFTLINEYMEGRIPLYHFDLYRLATADATRLAPDLYWEGDEYEPGLVVIEWAERLQHHPAQYLQIKLSIAPTLESRTLHMIGIGGICPPPIPSPSEKLGSTSPESQC
ncbi:MAG: tRNA (adenosine(37)-N6)-threonylcarbamoyltransferase complex ATPase subunit type 1 TsaE [Cyanothece sp. SIO2G6]|nr:tRNA (adenosine(37)-N6)-threonylcarbamoyltransferase complex ATPase subunit type 1 TsaE [Cyanothece sp. SIO2G6]